VAFDGLTDERYADEPSTREIPQTRDAPDDPDQPELVRAVGELASENADLWPARPPGTPRRYAS
jgi:hypothetical protein